MDKKSEKFLFDYLNEYSPTCFESEGQKLWLNYIKEYTDTYISDNYGSLAAIINPNKDYKVVIEAHADEIAWFVKYISPEGYLYVARNGGSDHQIAPSMRVFVHSDKGKVSGVFGWPAIHIRDRSKEKSPDINKLFVDIGVNNKEEVEKLGIHVGTVVTFQDGLMELGENHYAGRALDNRIGGFMIAEVARRLKENKVELPFSLYVVNAVQEEIGLNGATMISRTIAPDVAIITDVTHDTLSPAYSKTEHGDVGCGQGPVLSYGASVHNNLNKLIEDVANKNDIKFQRQAASRWTGTDTDAFAYSAKGVPSALISIPLKYMHTTVETIHKDDIEKTIQLMYHSILAIESGHDFRYIK